MRWGALVWTRATVTHQQIYTLCRDSVVLGDVRCSCLDTCYCYTSTDLYTLQRQRCCWWGEVFLSGHVLLLHINRSIHFAETALLMRWGALVWTRATVTHQQIYTLCRDSVVVDEVRCSCLDTSHYYTINAPSEDSGVFEEVTKFGADTEKRPCLPETHVVIITPLHFLQDNTVSEEASTCPRFREGEAISSHRQDMTTSGGRAFVWPKLQALL